MDVSFYILTFCLRRVSELDGMKKKNKTTRARVETSRIKREHVVSVSWSFISQWSVRASWVLDATSSWMDSLLVSHQPPSLPLFLPPSLAPLLSVLKSTNWATPALLPTSSPLSCSSLLRVYTPKGLERADWAHNKHSLPASSPPPSPARSFILVCFPSFTLSLSLFLLHAR